MASEGPRRVEDVMTTPLETIGPEETIERAAELMSEYEISALVVGSSPYGIVTSTDVVDAVADGRDTSSVTVSELMTEEVETISQDLFMEEAATMLATFGIKHLPVVDVEGNLVGMLSSSDVTAHLLSD